MTYVSDTTERVKVGTAVRERMTALGFTEDELARKTALSPGTRPRRTGRKSAYATEPESPAATVRHGSRAQESRQSPCSGVLLTDRRGDRDHRSSQSVNLVHEVARASISVDLMDRHRGPERRPRTRTDGLLSGGTW
jgi:hypothetical protein